jgi:Fic family protein
MNKLLPLLWKFLEQNPGKSSGEIAESMGADWSLATVKRALKESVARGLLETDGQGRGTRYFLSEGAKWRSTVELDDYFSKEIDERRIRSSYRWELLETEVQKYPLFTEEERTYLQALQTQFRHNINQLSPIQQEKEMERLAIDLSWKSSQIEGNTYSLLDTERLLLSKVTAEGKTKDEAVMLLNHKETIDFLLEHPDYLTPLSRHRMEDIHRMLTHDLGVQTHVRNHRVGISGTNYTPLDNDFQIQEALDTLCLRVNECSDPFDKALLCLLFISYIQPFEDGNKRTARIVSNACLLQDGYCPLSYRTVDPLEYKKAMLLFYEQNNPSAVRKLFIEQYAFAVNTYF